MDKRHIELIDTIAMMQSEKYKERFKAEYFQLKIRYEKLAEMTAKYEAGALSFKPSCSLELLNKQKFYMKMYLQCLEERAVIEKIDLDAVDWRTTTGGWIDINDDTPPKDEYVLLSFDNYSMADIGRYEENDEGGAFYPGDEETSYVSFGIIVNAWRPLPEPYRPNGKSEEKEEINLNEEE